MSYRVSASLLAVVLAADLDAQVSVPAVNTKQENHAWGWGPPRFTATVGLAGGHGRVTWGLRKGDEVTGYFEHAGAGIDISCGVWDMTKDTVRLLPSRMRNVNTSAHETEFSEAGGGLVAVFRRGTALMWADRPNDRSDWTVKGTVSTATNVPAPAQGRARLADDGARTKIVYNTVTGIPTSPTKWILADFANGVISGSATLMSLGGAFGARREVVPMVDTTGGRSVIAGYLGLETWQLISSVVHFVVRYLPDPNARGGFRTHSIWRHSALTYAHLEDIAPIADTGQATIRTLDVPPLFLRITLVGGHSEVRAANTAGVATARIFLPGRASPTLVGAFLGLPAATTLPLNVSTIVGNGWGNPRWPAPAFGLDPVGSLFTLTTLASPFARRTNLRIAHPAMPPSAFELQYFGLFDGKLWLGNTANLTFH